MLMNGIYLMLATCANQTSSANPSEGNSTIIAAIIAVLGVVLGAILTLFTQLLLNSIENKRAKKKQIYEKQLEIYPIVLEYITFYAQIQQKIKNRENANIINSMIEMEKEKYNKFFYIFSLISSSKTVKGFNELRERIVSQNLPPDKAYEELIDLLQKDKY